MFKKTLSVFIAFLMTISLFFQNASVSAKETSLDFENIDSRIVCELLNEREEKTKCFELSDGQVLKVEYPVAVHNLNELGKWEDICFDKESQNSVILSEFSNDENPVTIFYDNCEISWKYLNSDRSKLQESEDKKIYKNIYKNIDLEYSITEKSLKENLILNSKSQRSEFEIEYVLKGLTPKKVDDKTVKLLNKDGNPVYNISAPVMFDNEGSCSDALLLEILSYENDILKIKMVCDKKWLQSSERSYPITIDPEYELNFEAATQIPTPLTISTRPQKKQTNSSIFLDLRGADFKNLGCLKVTIMGRKSSDSSVEENCTCSATCFYLEAGQKYELWNNIIEKRKGYDEAQLLFESPEGFLPRLGGKGSWNPEYNAGEHNKDGKCVQIGSPKGSRGISRDTSLSPLISVDTSCWITVMRTKGNDSFVYISLQNAKGRGTVEVKVEGIPSTERYANFQNYTDYPSPPTSGTFTLELGKKYILTNSLRENKCTGMRLQIKGASDKDLEGAVWSPDFAPCKQDEDAIKMPGGSTSLTVKGVPIREIPSGANCLNVPVISQNEEGYPTGCESASAVMLLRSLGFDVSMKDFVDNYLPRADFSGTNGPHPDEFFVGHPARSKGSFGCLAPCISRALNDFFIAKNAKFTAYVLKNESVPAIVHQLVEKEKRPVLVWVTMGMLPTKMGSTSWTLSRNRGKYDWPGNEHCVVLVGQSQSDYFVNDPLQSRGKVRGAYEKSLLESRYNEQGKQIVAVRPVSSEKPFFPKTGDITQMGNPFSSLLLGSFGSITELLASFNKRCDKFIPMFDGTTAGKLLENLHFKPSYPTENPKAYGDREFFVSEGYYINQSGKGWTDLVLVFEPTIAEVYEVKSILNRKKLEHFLSLGKESKDRTLGANQVKAYASALNSSEKLKEKYHYRKAVEGTTYNPNGVQLPYDKPKYEYRTFYLDDEGMIYWKYLSSKDPKSKEKAKQLARQVPAINELASRAGTKIRDLYEDAVRNKKTHIIIGGVLVGVSAISLAVFLAPYITAAGAVAVGTAGTAGGGSLIALNQLAPTVAEHAPQLQVVSQQILEILKAA